MDEATNGDCQLLKIIEESQLGFETTIPGPFGRRKVVYTDYTASGRALSFVEDYLNSTVLPLYANTHTGTSHLSRQTTNFREEARDIIRSAVNASESDVVLFTGSGTTGAVHTLIHLLNLSSPPVVFVGPFEHHSNLLPWRELGAEVVMIDETSSGGVDHEDLETKLKQYSDTERTLIGTFSAASNLTGVMSDTVHISCLLHQYGALSLWDFATAAPYLDIDMNPVTIRKDAHMAYKDAVFFSMHKFVGGVDSPGVLVAKKSLFRNPTPHQCGGGTVFFVTPSHHRYFKSEEAREEGGTPSIIGAIRAGLAMRLKQAVGTDLILQKENELCRQAYSRWSDIEQLVLVGPPPSLTLRLPIFSFLVLHSPSRRFLHHNFVCALLNDLFGIQARGGCSCAGPYAQRLLGINEQLSNQYETLIMEDNRLDRVHLRRHREYSEQEVLRPGVTRLSLPYFISNEAANFIITAVTMIAQHGWKLLPQYRFDPESGLFHHHRHQQDKERIWLGSFLFENLSTKSSPLPSQSPSYEETLANAKRVFDEAAVIKAESHTLSDQTLFLSDEAKQLRWFLLPSEAQEWLLGSAMAIPTPPPFNPRQYSSITPVTSNEKEEETKVEENGKIVQKVKFCCPPKDILKPVMEAISHYDMIQDGDRVLVCLSGGKDSLSLLHTLHQYQFAAKSKGVRFELGAVTVDPGSSSYNPQPLIPYLASLGVPYFFEQQPIIQQAVDLPECASICSFCSRLKRGRIYACARREKYNVVALGQHLDDLAESFLMSVFHNGLLRTMKAQYTVLEGDLRVVRPLVFVREKKLRSFAAQACLPVIAENCPACFASPKERHRMKQLLAAQELLFPTLFQSLLTAMTPLMARRDAQQLDSTRDDLRPLEEDEELENRLK